MTAGRYTCWILSLPGKATFKKGYYLVLIIDIIKNILKYNVMSEDIILAIDSNMSL